MPKRDANDFPLARTPNSTRYRTDKAWMRASGLGYKAPEQFYAVFGNTTLTPKQLGIIVRAWARDVIPFGDKVEATTVLQYFKTMKMALDAGNLEAAYGKNDGAARGGGE